MNSNKKGNIALGQAIAYFTKKGYIVSIPLNDSQKYDLIIEKEDILQTVQVKFTSKKNKTKEYYACSLVTTSGTSGKKLYAITETNVDLLFCVCENFDKYLIPVKKINNQNQILLSKHKIERVIFDSSQYFIKEEVEQ